MQCFQPEFISFHFKVSQSPAVNDEDCFQFAFTDRRNPGINNIVKFHRNFNRRICLLKNLRMTDQFKEQEVDISCCD